MTPMTDVIGMKIHNTMENKKNPKVSIVVLNWNGWSDTVICLDSLLELNYQNFEIVVVDNGSTDESSFMLNQYITIYEKNENVKPIINIHLINNKKNSGYAGGNNIGIKYSLNNNNADVVWVLNNDTTVEPNALSEIIIKMQSGFDVVGSQIRYSSNPNTLWCECGGNYSPWTMASTNVSLNENICVVNMTVKHEEDIEKKLGYIAGASILFSRLALEKVGLFSEDYFLYFEEPDWFNRAKIHNIRYGYASKSIVFHAVGKSTDKYNMSTGKFYSFRKLQFINSIKFTLKFHKTQAFISIPIVITREIMHFANFIYRRIKSISKRLIPKSLGLPLRWYRLLINKKLDKELFWIKNHYRNQTGRIGIDIGANIGFYSYGLRRCFSEIHAFEPIKEVSRFLIDCNLKNVTVHNFACSDVEGESLIYIPKIKNINEHSYAGLDVNNRHDNYDSIEIMTKRLDSFKFAEVDFIKIDVEGFEQRVLEGAHNTINATHPILLIELENRHRENAVKITADYLRDKYGYKGYFLRENKLIPLDEHVLSTLQRLDKDGEPINPYINNFIFI
jgi:FkbM family methyltransferase